MKLKDNSVVREYYYENGAKRRKKGGPSSKARFIVDS